MLNLLADYYNLPAARFVPLEVATVAPDYYLYLFEVGNTEYVVVEVDYLSGMPGIVRDIERIFDVRALGWCVRKERHKHDRSTFLPPDSDDYDPDGTNDANNNNYQDAVQQVHGWRYAILQVEPPSNQN